MLTEEDVATRSLLRCGEEKHISAWPQQVYDELDGIFHVSEGQIAVSRVLGLSKSLSTVPGGP